MLTSLAFSPDISLHAKCADAGFEASDNNYVSINAKYQLPDHNPLIWGSGHYKQVVATLPISARQWAIRPPCAVIKDLHYWFKIGSGFFEFGDGADGKLSFQLGDGKPVRVGEDLDAGWSTVGRVNLKKVYGKEHIDIRDIKKLELLDEPSDAKGKQDEWKLQGMSFFST